MTDRDDIRRAITEAISDDKELRALIESVPDRVSATVTALTPVDTGTAKASIEVKARRSPWKRLSTRRIKVGEVYSDDDPQKIATLEYGRNQSDNNGPTPEFAMFRKAAARWNETDL